MTRKLMRVGKFVEHFRAAAVASDAKSMDPVLRYTKIGRQLGYAAYMLLDNITVVSNPAVFSVFAGSVLGQLCQVLVTVT
jgi:hypothetical protein